MSYKIAEKMRYDKEQTVLTKKGCKSNPYNYSEKQDKANYNIIVLCPFCLTQNPLYKFEKHHGFYKCLICNGQMALRTLVREMKIEEFARWVFDYRLNGFWQKVYPTHKLWCARLKELGLAYEFWENYNRLKGVQQEQREFEEDYE